MPRVQFVALIEDGEIKFIKADDRDALAALDGRTVTVLIEVLLPDDQN